MKIDKNVTILHDVLINFDCRVAAIEHRMSKTRDQIRAIRPTDRQSKVRAAEKKEWISSFGETEKTTVEGKNVIVTVATAAATKEEKKKHECESLTKRGSRTNKKAVNHPPSIAVDSSDYHAMRSTIVSLDILNTLTA